MSLKDIYFFTTMSTSVLMAILFYLLGKYFMKPKRKKTKNMIFIVAAFVYFTVITLNWLCLYLNPLYSAMLSGLWGAVIGLYGIQTKEYTN